MKTTLSVLLIILLVACSSEPEPFLYSGPANGITSNDLYPDTLKICYCWQTNDSTTFRVTNSNYAGTAVQIIIKNNVPKASIQYYSDTNEFDGEFTLDIPTKTDSLALSYQETQDSLTVTGYFKVQSTEFKTTQSNNPIVAAGIFDCTMNKLN